MLKIWLTGYRSYELGIFKDSDLKIKVIKLALQQTILNYLDQGCSWIISGGQLGIEQWGLEVAQTLKAEYDFKTAMMLPFQEFGHQWKPEKQIKLQELIKMTNFSASISNQAYHSPQQLKNYQQFMLAHTDMAIMVYDSEYPGKSQYDYQAIQAYKMTHDYPLHLIDFIDLQEIAREHANSLKNHD
jgi:uncharacterized phage-like protein YoqJ